mmetsp:Transcript_36752/g.46856  ORF Transcript_36752/g.46856 Transcript_36752/m.46856 type:complete len:401 (-) Transcript_36752:223-1425(-)
MNTDNCGMKRTLDPKVHPSSESDLEDTTKLVSIRANDLELEEESALKMNDSQGTAPGTPSNFTPVISYSACSDIGERGYQEDRLVHIEDFNLLVPKSNTNFNWKLHRAFFAVYDGHGGASCSSYLADQLHMSLAQHKEVGTNPIKALTEVWQEADKAFLALCQESYDASVERHKKEAEEKGLAEPTPAHFPRDGSTAFVCFIVGSKMYIANCGDSAGCLVDKNRKVTMLSDDHGTLNEMEVQRILERGGEIRPQLTKAFGNFPCCCKLVDRPVGKPRAYPGGLLVTRAFGDYHSKLVSLGGIPGSIIPDFSSVKVFDIDENFNKILMASDGVWDALDVSDIVELITGDDTTVEQRKKGDHKYLSEIVSEIITSAVESDYWDRCGASADNTSAILIQFSKI